MEQLLGTIKRRIIVTMFEEIRRKIISMVVVRKNEAASLTGELPTRVFERMNKNPILVGRFKALYSGDWLWEV